MASARELRRQQREEEGPGDEAEGAEEGPGPPRANLSPSSSFRAQRSARGSTFSLWQDIPDVRGSGVLATLSLRDCKLQEVRRGPGGAGPAGPAGRGQRGCRSWEVVLGLRGGWGNERGGARNMWFQDLSGDPGNRGTGPAGLQTAGGHRTPRRTRGHKGVGSMGLLM